MIAFIGIRNDDVGADTRAPKTRRPETRRLSFAHEPQKNLVESIEGPYRLLSVHVSSQYDRIRGASSVKFAFGEAPVPGRM
jgi:hypothetical protein